MTLFEQHLADKDEISLTNKDVVSATSQIHRLFLLDGYKNDLVTAFGVGNQPFSSAVLLPKTVSTVQKVGIASFENGPRET